MKHKPILITICVIFIIGIIGSVWVLNAPKKSFVRVVSDGKTVYTADLGVTADTSFDVEYQGHVNTVEIRDHRIRVKSADCPDQTCVKMGYLHSAAMPVVCLPHKLVIEFTETADGVDAVTR